MGQPSRLPSRGRDGRTRRRRDRPHPLCRGRQRRKRVERRAYLELRAGVDGVLAGQDRGPQGLEIGAFGKHGQFHIGKLRLQRGDHPAIQRHAARQQHSAHRPLALVHERDHFVGHAVVERVQHVLDAGLVPIELVGDVGLAVDGATKGQGDDAALKRAAHGLVQVQSQPADLLDVELAAAGRALVVRKDGPDPRPFQQVDGEDLAPREATASNWPPTYSRAACVAATSEICP